MSELTLVIEQVRGKLPLTDLLISRGFTLRRSGQRFVTLCPFHSDRRRPNLVIYPDEQKFHCFSCGARGDVVDMVMHLDRHPDFVTALRSLAEQLRVDWPDGPPAASPDAPSGVLTLAANVYVQQLTGAALRYLAGRGFPEPFVRKLKIGYAPENAPQFLRSKLKAAGISPDAAFASGVVVRTGEEKDAVVRDFFAAAGGGYLIFPNFGRRRQVVDLQGRAFPQSDRKPRYLNLPRSRRYLWNEATLPKPAVILAEGIPDAMSCLLVDLPAVAVYGTGGFNPSMVGRFARVRRVYVAFDNDAPDRSIAVACAFGLRGRLLLLPTVLGDKGDLNDLLQKVGPASFREAVAALMASAPTGYATQIERLPADLSVWDLFDEAAPLLAVVANLDPISRDKHLELLEHKFRVGVSTLRDAAAAALDTVPWSAATGGHADAAGD